MKTFSKFALIAVLGLFNSSPASANLYRTVFNYGADDDGEPGILTGFMTLDLSQGNGYTQVQQDLIKRMSKNSKIVKQGTYIIWVAHNLERISDRSTNIAERTLYVLTGDSSSLIDHDLDE